MQNKNYIYISLAIVAVAMTRLLPHSFNFSPLGALALFAGSKLEKKSIAVAVPLLAVFISDLFLNNFFYRDVHAAFTFFYEGWYFVYLSYALTTIGAFYLLKKDNAIRIISGAIGASVVFFLLSNLSNAGPYLALTPGWPGILACYEAGIPFFKATLIGNLVWSLVLFGIYHLILQQRFKLTKERV